MAKSPTEKGVIATAAAAIENVFHSQPVQSPEPQSPVPGALENTEQSVAPKAEEKKTAKTAHIKHVKHETSGPCPGDYVDRSPKVKI